jgi:hypothetical protein
MLNPGGKRFSLLIVAAFISAVMISFGMTGTPGGKKRYLILAEYDVAAASNHTVHIVRIPFTDGIPGAREKVMDVVIQQPGDKVPHIRFDLGRNQIYRNRYIITAYGQVVDMTDKKVLVETHDQFVKASGDSIVFYINDIARGKFFSVLDLKTGSYAEATHPDYHPLPGKGVETDCSQRNYKIWYYPPSKPKVEVVKDAGYGEDYSLIPNGRSHLPIHWIDNANFIYPYYNSLHTVATIYQVNSVTHEQVKVGVIDQLPENRKYTEFLTDPDGNIVYSCARGYFRIDTKKNVVEEMKFFRAGHGFEIAIEETPGKGNEVKQNGSSIGYYFCTPKLAVTTEDGISFPFEIVMEGEHYLQGAAYWSGETSKWKTAGDSDLCSVVGWTTE